MTPTDALTIKDKIDSTGEALLTLFTEHSEYLVVGQVYTMTSRNDRLYLRWKIPYASHGFSFTRAMVTNPRYGVLWTDQIAPVRADNSSEGEYSLELDYA